jgi:hypothetical protein
MQKSCLSDSVLGCLTIDPPPPQAQQAPIAETLFIAQMSNVANDACQPAP